MRNRFVTERTLLGFGLVVGIVLTGPTGVTRLASSGVRDDAALHGTVSVLQVRGPSDTHPFPVWVWRPPGPDSASIPVIYFLHGYPGAARDAFSVGLAGILDRRLAEGYPPVVVACPDGNGEHHSDTEWANSWNGNDRVMSRVVSADIAAVEGTHRRPSELRAIAGFSMGGYGAMNIAMQDRGLFGSEVSIAGYFLVNDLSDMFGDRQGVIRVNSPWKHPGWAAGMNVILEEDAQDPNKLIHGEAAWMARLLRQANVPVTLRILPGVHSWSYALRAFQDALTFLDADWQRDAARSAAAQASPAGYTAPADGGSTDATSPAVNTATVRSGLALVWRQFALATRRAEAALLPLLR